jgi:prepilin-type processing-associated H-X9-DG protein
MIVGTVSFPNITNFLVTKHCLFSYCWILNLPTNCPLDTTPIGFTRGLREDGLWDKDAGLYGSKGGYIVYADGHVKWCDGDKPVKFLRWDGTGYTNDIRYAVPSSTWIGCGNENIKTNYAPDGKLVILYHKGLGGD